MNGNVEYRRKHANLDSSGATANLISRESFTLDEPVPKTPTINNHGFSELPLQDKRNFLLLVLLYFLQGVPMGLAAGSVPFLLKPHMSCYGVPIVDAIWSPKVGRRKSWIMPIQMLSGFGMIWLGSQIKEMMITAGENDGAGIWSFTGWWFFLVFMCATQDIAVDGWALTLLSPGNISYASTAQTVGLTAGQFMSFTVFLAFNAPDFANKWFRTTPLDEGVMTLGGYLTFWGWAYIIVTIGLALLKREEKTKNEDGIWDVYKVMWGVLKLKNIQTIIIIHLIAKIGFQANDGVTNLKLIDKGFSQEDMALTVLIDFPFEIGLGYYAGKWSTSYTPLRLWCWGFVGRLVAAVIAQITVVIFPANGVDTWYLLVVIAEHIFSTFTNTVMFVAISAFHARIADPVIGGTYMTLLATVSNLGGTFPRFFVLKLVDYFTTATCIPPSSGYKLAAGLKGPLVNWKSRSSELFWDCLGKWYKFGKEIPFPFLTLASRTPQSPPNYHSPHHPARPSPSPSNSPIPIHDPPHPHPHPPSSHPPLKTPWRAAPPRGPRRAPTRRRRGTRLLFREPPARHPRNAHLPRESIYRFPRRGRQTRGPSDIGRDHGPLGAADGALHRQFSAPGRAARPPRTVLAALQPRDGLFSGFSARGPRRERRGEGGVPREDGYGAATVSCGQGEESAVDVAVYDDYGLSICAEGDCAADAAVGAAGPVEHKIQSTNATDASTLEVKGSEERERREDEEEEEEEEEVFDNFDSSPAVPRSKRLIVDLDPVPKFLKNLVDGWAPEGMIVSFKLETDPSILVHKAKYSLDRYQHHFGYWEFARDEEMGGRVRSAGGVEDLVGAAARGEDFGDEPLDPNELPDGEPELEIESLIIPAVEALHTAHINGPRKRET
ncbi:hypothetical protein DID88_007566 [Monilinia fructigena]|uniref:Uncharacterized protein n=1 Tax=Monilinia fructigena TaxID=38457 RepID=A0A395J544_9HELO|nr:hypothetical protein DID88_007566 [Monilinia fructigena]